MLLRAVRVVGALLMLQACSVSPLCLDCLDFDGSTSDSALDLGGASGHAGGTGGTGAAGTNAGTGSDADGDRSLGGRGPSDAAVSDAAVSDACAAPSPELCNGLDDDCDLRVDEDAFVDEFECGDVGECTSGHTRCVGGEIVCRYSPAHEEVETRCDDIDNDCDGRVDETFLMLGDACSTGIGACAAGGTLHCNAGGDDLVCEAEAVPAPRPEVCDGIDNDCDGLVDEPQAEPGFHASFVQDALADLGNGVKMFIYEASRPDATAQDRGMHTARACSKRNVLPWTGVSFATAQAACEAAGYRLCTAEEWLAACEGGNANAYPYGSSYDAESCNGAEHDANASEEGIQNALVPTASLASCASGGGIFDLSGNAKEWTDDPEGVASGQTLYVVRGGSYQSSAPGLSCQTLLSQAMGITVLPTLGFRCCGEDLP